MQKAIHACVSASGFVIASVDLRKLAEVDISANRLGRLVERIGNERIAQMEAQSATYQSLPLPAQRTCPIAMAPEVVCVQCDGGRMQIRDRKEPVAESDSGQPRASFWKETKVATLLKMTSETYAEDPCPMIPQTFVDAARMKRLTREIKGFSGEKANSEAVCQSPNESVASCESILLSPDELHQSTRPKPLLRSVLASTKNIHQFGKQVVAAAHARGFHAATRKAFVCDGMACNWTLHETHFSRYTPIVDFVHALCYVYHAAMAGRAGVVGWSIYCQWAQWLWSGQIAQLVDALSKRQQELGPPADDEPDTSPKRLLADAFTYLKNQGDRMRYSEYRKHGLPITSAYIESAIKQINRRVKGTEKFWSTNANPIVQLRADHLSETEPLIKFWRERCQHIPTSTYYKMAK
jgi:hypothetical protein